MKKHLLQVGITLLAFAALGITAKAQVPDQAVIKIPYAFVVGDTTLPAGTYRLTRADSVNGRHLLLSSIENRTGVFVLPLTVDNVFADKASFIFEQIGGQHILTKIETTDHVFTLPVSKSAVLLAKSDQGAAASSASGAN